MSTPKQIHANRANATQSTGPKSEAAKKQGSMHALSHGLAATQPLLPGEDVKEYEQERRAWFEKGVVARRV